MSSVSIDRLSDGAPLAATTLSLQIASTFSILTSRTTVSPEASDGQDPSSWKPAASGDAYTTGSDTVRRIVPVHSQHLAKSQASHCSCPFASLSRSSPTRSNGTFAWYVADGSDSVAWGASSFWPRDESQGMP